MLSHNYIDVILAKFWSYAETSEQIKNVNMEERRAGSEQRKYYGRFLLMKLPTLNCLDIQYI